MAYIGNAPDVNAFTLGVDLFNGTGACTQFSLTRDIDDAKAIEVVLNGVQQNPTDSYSVTDGVITFTEPPSLGSNNIVVTYRAPIVVTFNQVSASQLLPSSVTTTALATNSIERTKIQNDTITGDKIAINQITGNLIANNAVSGNNIVTPPDIFDDAFLFGGM